MARQPEIIVIEDDDGDDYPALRPTPPPQRRDVVGDHRAAAFPASAPPKWRPSGGGILLGRCDDLPTSSRQSADALRVLDRSDNRRVPIPLPTSPRQKRDEVDPSPGRRLSVLTPPPRQRDVVGDRHAVAFPASAPPKWRPSGGGFLVGHPEEPSLPFLTPPPADKPDFFGVRNCRRILSTPPPAAIGSVVFRDPFQISGDEEEDDASISTPPPPKRRLLFIHQATDGGPTLAKLPSSDSDGHRDFVAASGFGSRYGGRCRSVPLFRDPFEVPDDEDEDDAAFSSPPLPKRRSLSINPVDTTDGKNITDNVISSSGPSDKVGLCSGHGGHGSSQGRGGGPAGGRTNSSRGGRRGRGAGFYVGRSSGRVLIKHTGRGSRARALIDLLGDGDPCLTADGGPTQGQNLKTWEFERNMDLNQEYEYLDGLLTRIQDLPTRVTALTKKGWNVFYTRLNICYLVRRQMREAKADPAPVPERFLPEVAYIRRLKSEADAGG